MPLANYVSVIWQPFILRQLLNCEPRMENRTSSYPAASSYDTWADFVAMNGTGVAQEQLYKDEFARRVRDIVVMAQFVQSPHDPSAYFMSFRMPKVEGYVKNVNSFIAVEDKFEVFFNKRPVGLFPNTNTLLPDVGGWKACYINRSELKDHTDTHPTVVRRPFFGIVPDPREIPSENIYSPDMMYMPV